MVADQLSQLSALLDLAEQASPIVQATGDTTLQSLWDWLLEQIKGLIDNLSSGLTDTFNNTINTIKNWVSDKVGEAKKAIENGVKAISTGISNAVVSVSSAVETAERNIKGFIEDTLSGIGDVIGDAIRAVANAIASIRDAIAGIAQEFAQTIASFIGVIVDDLSYALGQALKEITTRIGQLLSPIIERLANIFNAVKDGITHAIEAVREWLTNAYETVRNGITTAVQSVGDWITNAYNAAKDWIGGAIERVKEAYETVKTTVEDLIQRLLDFLKQAFASFVRWFNEVLVPWAQNALLNVLKALMAASNWAKGVTGLTDEDIQAILHGDLEPLKKAMVGTGKTLGELLTESPIYGFLYAVSYMHHEISLAFLPSQIAASKQAEINLGLNPAPADLVFTAYFMGRMSKEEVIENMRLAGISRERAERALQGLVRFPTPGDVQEAYLRGIIDEETHDWYMHALGFSDKEIKIFKMLYWRLPPVSDIIRMAVREAFTPEIAEKFGQYEDYPELFTDFAKQLGFSEQWAKAYWAAHWDLPSPTQGFEMLHRGIITEDELKLLLRALDVMPFWREKLIKLSYNPLTRVDVRRMYQMGVLTEEEVYRAYLDLGYNPDNARKLTEFTKRYNAPEDESELSEFRRLARSAYSQAYRKRIISREEYKAFLLGLKYVEQDADLLISIDDYAIADKEKIFDLDNYRKDYHDLVVKAYKVGVLSYDDFVMILRDLGYSDTEISLEVNALEAERNFYLRSLVLDRVGEMYVNFIIDDTQVYTYLNVFGFTQAEIDRAIEEWQISRNLRTKRPPLSDLKRFYDAGLITLEDYLNELRGQGYNEKYIDLYRAYLGG